MVDVLPLDVEGDPAAALAALGERHKNVPFDGITTLYDPAVPFVAEAAEALGLPGLGSGTARAVQDKRIMRRRLAEAGLNVPGFVVLDDPGTPADATGLDFPVVVKPANGFSSLGVTKADSAERLGAVVDEVWQVCRSKLHQVTGLVVEEFLDGPELAVESFAHRGTVQVLTVGYKGEPVGPHFEEGVYRAPALLPPHVQDAVVREVVAAHSALGVTDGPTHTELRLRGGERPYLLELGARIGGSGVSHYIAEHVTGADLAADALRLAAGLAPCSLPDSPAQPARARARRPTTSCRAGARDGSPPSTGWRKWPGTPGWTTSSRCCIRATSYAPTPTSPAIRRSSSPTTRPPRTRRNSTGTSHTSSVSTTHRQGTPSEYARSRRPRRRHLARRPVRALA